jgi:hypothetical protein
LREFQSDSIGDCLISSASLADWEWCFHTKNDCPLTRFYGYDFLPKFGTVWLLSSKQKKIYRGATPQPHTNYYTIPCLFFWFNPDD